MRLRIPAAAAGTLLWLGCLAAHAAPPQAPALERAIREVRPAHLTLLEAGAGPDLAEAEVDQLGERIRTGGSLLLTLGEHPGRLPMRLAFLSPTTAWMVSGANTLRPAAAVAQTIPASAPRAKVLSDPAKISGPTMSVAELDLSSALDPEFFLGDAAQAVPGLKVSSFFEIRPFHAVERGQARYDRYERRAPWQAYTGGVTKDARLPPDADWWTRPLLNRDWRIRVRLDDHTGSPLLLTGRYGAGRVAVLATSAAALPDSPAAEAFWKATLTWLNAATPAVEGAATFPPPEIAADLPGHGALIALRNPAATEQRVQLVARRLSWERAPIGDELREVMIPAAGSVLVKIPLPRPSPTSYEELAERDAFRIRVGVLSASGATLLAEKTQEIDLRPPVRLTVTTEELREHPNLFPETPEPGQPVRMGLPVATYAYPPGATVQAQVTVAVGLSNLAPLAEVRDETNPANPTLVALTDEGASSERRPVLGEPKAWGFFEGRADTENVLRFTFAEPVRLAAVTLIGAGDEYRNQHLFNPDRAAVEIDGKPVAEEPGLAARFLAERGLVRIPFAPVTGRVLRLRLPWPAGSPRHTPPRLAEVRLEGSVGPVPVDAGKALLSVTLRNTLTGAAEKPFLSERISVPPSGQNGLYRKRFSFALPPGDTAGFYRLEASLTPPIETDPPLHAAAPILAVAPAHPLISMARLKPPEAVSVGFIVTRGFREFFDRGVGTAEIGEGWGQPDDLVWAYAHGFKQLGANAHTPADRLYLSESDFRHYSTPWRQFEDGEEFYDLGTPGLIERLKRDPHWKNAGTVVLGHSDRWDAGPDVGALHAWPDFEGFDAWLRERKLGSLRGRTHRELADEVEQQYRGAWDTWHQERYARDIRTLRDAVAAEGKKLVITAQGVSLIPTPGDAAVIGEVVRGMSDDHTWGMAQEDVPYTTGRQMGSVAFNPWLAMSTLNQWGYVSAALNNPQWHSPVGTTEPARRVLFDRAFRGTILPDGRYASMHTYGYNDNAGFACTLNEGEYNAWERVQQKHSLLTPDGPLGLGVVLTTAHLQPVESRRFTCGGGGELPETRAVQALVQRLQNAGLSVSFSANAGTLAGWKGDAPLVLANVEHFSPEELETLQRLSARGVRLAAFCGEEKIPAPVAAFFGVKEDGTVRDGRIAGRVGERPVIAKGGNLFVPVSPLELQPGAARELAGILHEGLQLPITFPPGVTGYGFTSNGRSFIVAEDWLEQGRTVSLRVRARPETRSLRAVETSEHRPLVTRRDSERTSTGVAFGSDWTIELPLRPGDGALVAFEELP